MKASVLALFVLGLLCLGPAPGEIGACGSDAVAADPVDHCTQVAAWECARLEAIGAFPYTPPGGAEQADVQACVDAIACLGTTWPATCFPAPTHVESQACIDELKRADNVNIARSDIPECNLCP